jgi:hypothetical protein
MGERNSANAQTRVELKTARWRPRREIDEFAAAGPAPIPFHGKSPCTQATTASFSARHLNRKQPFSFNRRLYKERRRIENAFGRLKDFRRIATRYDRLARNFLASVCIVAALVVGLMSLDPSTRLIGSN